MTTNREDKILTVLENGGKSVAQISIEAGINYYIAKKILKTLGEENKIKTETNEKGTRTKYSKVDENGNDTNRMA